MTLILMNDEGRRELIYSGTELHHDVGFEDYRGYLSINESDEFKGVLVHTDTYVLNKGDYSIKLSYLTDTENNTVEIYNDGVFLKKFELSNVNTYMERPFSFDKDMQRVEVRVYYAGTGNLKINEFRLAPDTFFYSDNIFFLGLFLLVNAVLLLLYCRHKKHPFRTEQLVDTCVLAALSFFATAPFFNTNLWHADDICYHMLRIEGLKDGILDGQIPVVIFPEAISGNGFLNSMYPYLFLYIPAVLRIFRVSLVLSYKFLIFLANVATVAGTYHCIKSVSKSRYAAILGATFYIYYPIDIRIFMTGELWARR